MFSSSFVKPADAECFLAALKRAAKHAKKSQADAQHKLAFFLDTAARALGYLNWSLLHKHVDACSPKALSMLFECARNTAWLAPFFPSDLTQPVDQGEAAREMERYTYKHFTPLVEFAYYDAEAENGYAWPSVDLLDELQEVFSGHYPFNIIERVANELEMKHGPWGVEDYGHGESV
jgi:hypothetical protein